MESKRRNLGTVIDAMLVHVPEGHALHDDFAALVKKLRYKAPEQMREGWEAAGMLLGGHVGPPNALTEDWQKRVVAIFMDTEVK